MTNQELINQDELDRSRIIHELDKNIFVEASAGSGKTSMLVKRMVALVESGVSVDKICTITFTKAAASEFRDRFQLLLLIRSKSESSLTKKEEKETLGLDKTTVKSRQYCQIALNNLDLCFMGTIDSFSNMIISEHPFDALVPSSSSVIGDSDLPLLYSNEYSAILNGEYGDSLKEKALLFERLNKDARKLFIHDFKTYIEKRTAHTIYKKPSNICIDDALKKEKRIFLNFINEVLDDPSNVLDNGSSMDEFNILKDNRKLLNGPWEGNEEKIFTLIKYTNKICLKDYPKGVADLSSYILKIVNKDKDSQRIELKHVKDSSCTDKNSIGDDDKTINSIIDEFKYNFTVDFFVDASNAIAPKLKKLGKLTFFDYSLYLVEMLQNDIRKDKSLISYIQKRHSHFLLDEFQDTDPMQSQMFFYLASSIPDVDIAKCKLKEGSLFIVGDPKQSIYRFRGADVESYINIENLFDKNNVIILSRNFRSTPIMKDYFNSCFSNLFPRALTKTQSTFSPIPFTEEIIESNLLEGVYSYEADKSSDPQHVCDIIKRVVHNDKFKIQGPKDFSPRTIKYSDFMLIPYGKTNISDYLIEFEKQNIPFVVEGKVTFSKCPALQDIYYIISSVINPTNPLSLYKALTCKTIGISEERLLNTGFKKLNYNIFNYKDKIMIKDKEFELVDELIIENLDKLHILYDKSLILNPSSLFKRILETYHLFERVSTDYLEYLYYAIELIKAKEKDGQISCLNDALLYLESLLKEESGIERCISLDRLYYSSVEDDGLDHSKIKIANLHKVKGLEASIVILLYSFNKPKVANNAYIRKTNEFYLFESSENLGSKTNIFYKTNNYSDIKERETLLLNEEKLRMLYVAATRARCALIISSYKNETQSKWFSLLYGTTKKDETRCYTPKDIFYYLDATNPLSSDEINYEENNEIDVSSLYEEASKNLIDTANKNLKNESLKLERPSLLDLDKEENYDIDTDTLKDLNFSKTVGTLVHLLMQKLVDSSDSYKKEDLICELVNISPNVPNIKLILGTVYDQIHNGGYSQENEAPTDILNTLLNAIECYTEVPFTYQLDGVLWHGVMDVIYKDKTGYHIIDYKTNIEKSNLDKQYEKQLKAYALAFKNIIGEEVVPLIYHINI